MRQPLVWIAVPLMLIGALLLVTGVGAAGLWIAVIAAGIAHGSPRCVPPPRGPPPRLTPGQDNVR